MRDMWWRLVRFGFRLLYHEMAFTYDTVSWLVSMGAWRCWQRTSLRHLPEPETGLILEIAHGTGNLQLDLQKAGYRAIGYDFSPQMGRLAQEKLWRNECPAPLIRGKAQQLPFADETFAAIVSTFPTDFIVQSTTIYELYRVLEPGGRVIIVPNGVFTGGGIVRSFLEWLYRITGQRSDTQMNAANVFEGYDFTVHAYEEACPRSVAQVVVLQK
jgi:ubiquinone/menaquinone biosynthesis C-methylase UbiE